MRRVQEEQECLGAALQAIHTNTTNVKCLCVGPWIVTRPVGPIQRDLWR